MVRKKSPRLAAAFVVTISAGCGGGTKEPINPSNPPGPDTPDTSGTSDTSGTPDKPPPQDDSWIPNIGAITPGIIRGNDGKCFIQHPANPPWSEEVDCETGKPPQKPEEKKPEEKKPDTSPPPRTYADLPDAPPGWSIAKGTSGCVAYPPEDPCPRGRRCNPPPPLPPMDVKCP